MAEADWGYPTGVAEPGVSPDYPLVRPSADVAGLLADFGLWHREAGARSPLRLARLVGFDDPDRYLSSSSGPSAGPPASSSTGGDDPAAVLVADALGGVVFDSRADDVAYHGRAWGRFVIHEWVGRRAWCRAVQHRGRAVPRVLAPERAVLDERTHDAAPGRVWRVKVNGEWLTGPLALEAGYNVVLSRPTALRPARAARQRLRLRLAAEAGTGAGKYLGCGPQEVPLRTVSRVPPSAGGDLRLEAAGCYRADRVSAITAESPRTAAWREAALQVRNFCRPCCACDDYVNTYQGLKRLHGDYRALVEQADAVRDQFRENKERWEGQKSCRQERPARLLLISAERGRVVVQASLCNNGDVCRYDVSLRLGWAGTLSGSAAAVEPGTAFQTDPRTGRWRPAVPDEGAGEAAARWERVDPGQAVRLRLTLRVPEDSVRCGDSLAVKARAADRAGAYGREEGRSVAVLCESGGAMQVD